LHQFLSRFLQIIILISLPVALRDILSELILIFLKFISKIAAFSHVILGHLIWYHENRTSTLYLIREQFAWKRLR